ncbi:unnamed protein product, partial [Rotaria sp. Silwood2]
NYMEMLSVRYSNRELYWINANHLICRAIWTNNRTWNITNYLRIKVNRLGTDHQLILRKGKNETIYALVVNPRRRFVYWCDRGPCVRISRSLLTGENITYLVTTQIIRPEAITIDFQTDDVY